MILPLETVVDRLVRKASRIGLQLRLKTTQLELETLHRTAELHFVPREWEVQPNERGVTLVIVYDPERTRASTTYEYTDRRLVSLRAVAVFQLAANSADSPEPFEQQVRPLVDAMRVVFPDQRLCLDYAVTTDFRSPPTAHVAKVNVAFDLDLLKGSFDPGFLEQAADALRRMGPGEALY